MYSTPFAVCYLRVEYALLAVEVKSNGVVKVAMSCCGGTSWERMVVVAMTTDKQGGGYCLVLTILH